MVNPAEDSPYSAAVQRLSAERLEHERRLALAANDPVARLQLGAAAAQAAAAHAAQQQHAHTHTHSHSHTHLHVHPTTGLPLTEPYPGGPGGPGGLIPFPPGLIPGIGKQTDLY